MSRTAQYVSNRLSMISLDEEDLESSTQFCKLLQEISQMLEPGGASLEVSRQLEEAQRELRLQRKVWFRSEIIHRILLEMLVDFEIRNRDGCLNDEESRIKEVLQQCMLVAECSHLLMPDVSTAESLLGLEKEDLHRLLPANTCISWMREQIKKYVEDWLKKKCFTFLSFHQPETDDDGDALRVAKALRLASTLEDEKRRLQNEREKHLETGAALEQQQEIYPQILLRCLFLMREAASELRLQSQSDIDRTNVDYLEAKSNALFLKLRMEELQVLTDTYTPEKLEVHRKIRENLEAALKIEKQELAVSQQILSSYEFLGPEFEELVQEYTQLRDKIKDNRWMLQELSKTLP
ncbi:HAUS augmin-like complex subunit 4 [Pelodytes ibericus]